MRRLGLVVLAVLWLSGAAMSDGDGAAKRGEEQLKVAYEIKKQSFKKEGDEKREILLRAVEAYRMVGASFPDDRKSCALAAFRIGEILRSLGERDQALGAFREVLTYADQHATVARALLEIGHIHRRDKELDLAIDLYAQVPRQCPGERTRGAQALLWIAKCHRTKKAYVDARSVLRELVTEYEGEHSTVLAAFDLLATSYLDEGDTDRARAILEECREHFRAVAEASDGPDSDLLAKVEKLKAWKRLAKAESGTE